MKAMAQETSNEARAALAGGNAVTGDASGRQGTMSVMGPDITVTGNIEALVDLNIEGRIVGDVRCATLVLGATSVVTGSIKADRVRVSGKVEGAIETTDLAIEAGAHVKGDVSYSRIRIANGAILEGQLTHKPVEESDAEVKLTLVEKPAAAPTKPLYFE